MPQRVQVILSDEDVVRFRSQAKREATSLSAWLRDAGRAKYENCGRLTRLNGEDALVAFFEECDAREQGQEPDWEAHKAAILEGQCGTHTP